MSQYGPVFSILTVSIIAHAILRHHLLEMRIVLRRGVVYVTALAASGAVLSCLIYLFTLAFHSAQRTVVTDILVGCAVAIIFLPIKATIEKLLDLYLYRSRYHYQSTVKLASEVISRRLKLPFVLECFSDVVNRTMKPDRIHIYLKADSSSPHYSLQFSSISATVHAPVPPASLGSEHAVPMALAARVGALSGDAGDGQPWGPELRRLGTDLAIPIVYETGLLGFVLLGPKLSGDAYFANDVDLLATLTNQAGLAIKNAQLYRQVVLINEYLQNIVATIESGVVAVDSAGQVTMFNRAAEHLTGRAADALLGVGAERLPVGLAEPLTATLEDGELRILPEIELAGPGGQVVPVMCLTSLLREPTGESLGAVAVFSDLTPVKELETQRRRAERLAYFETLAAGIAHEIKNPLVAIKTFVQLLPRRFGDEQFRERFGRVAGREVDRMLNLVERLQVLARPDSRQHRPLDLRAPVAEALELLQPRLEENRISVQWDPGPEPRYIVGGHEELEQLFLNLCINALEAMSPGGALVVRVAPAGRGWAVEIDDTGPGIRADLLPKMFDPFVTTKVHGSGLGLAICASIAHVHGATIRAVNKTGAPGAVFTVEFPEGALAGMPQIA
jgi:PAS domain S-box-containing protein